MHNLRVRGFSYLNGDGTVLLRLSYIVDAEEVIEYGGALNRAALQRGVEGGCMQCCHSEQVDRKKYIDSKKYDLVANYAHLWDGLHKNSVEAVFEIKFSGDNSGGRREHNRIALHLAAGNAEGYEEAYQSNWLFETMKNALTIDGEYSQSLSSTILFNFPKI